MPDEAAAGAMSAESLRARLLAPGEIAALDAPGRTDAAVLLPLYGWPEAPGLIFTRRRHDLSRHAGEISFPGGRHDDADPDLLVTALREAEEEIGLGRERVRVVGGLPPVGTFVTSYKVHPFVGLAPAPGEAALEANPAEVDAVLALSLAELRAGFGMRRLVRRGIPFRTPTYRVGDDVIWGATARILALFLERLDE